ncbi:hypothetical protein, partial [Bradyrhizobium pachyrhizi]|uniref:hypothetical protein n=1 Tax=Bradyrhizobium pachyrhizi TaxID=280333 RepID=UPI001AEBDFED
LPPGFRQDDGAYKISEYWKYIPDLPDVSSYPVEGLQPRAPLHGVVFDILPAHLRRPCKR